MVSTVSDMQNVSISETIKHYFENDTFENDTFEVSSLSDVESISIKKVVTHTGRHNTVEESREHYMSSEHSSVGVNLVETTGYHSDEKTVSIKDGIYLATSVENDVISTAAIEKGTVDLSDATTYTVKDVYGFDRESTTAFLKLSRAPTSVGIDRREKGDLLTYSANENGATSRESVDISNDVSQETLSTGDILNGITDSTEAYSYDKDELSTDSSLFNSSRYSNYILFLLTFLSSFFIKTNSIFLDYFNITIGVYKCTVFYSVLYSMQPKLGPSAADHLTPYPRHFNRSVSLCFIFETVPRHFKLSFLLCFI